jgi:anhydro-N-acetylmuramic acid kinase
MPLEEILRRKTLVVLGLNSGTSADGLDMAVVRISRGEKGLTIKYLAGAVKRYPQELQEYILNVADSNHIALNDVIHLDNMLGLFFGRAAAAFIKRLSRSGVSIALVASHGQTVRHLPEPARFGRFTVRGTLQLGSLDRIASATGKLTVGDFRQADIAAGGEGAPITVGAMHRLFASSGESRLIVNIGGMANYFYFPANKPLREAQAADCGPGNSLSDTLCRLQFDEKFDRNGRHAARGRVSFELLESLLSHPFFQGRGVSTGREIFGLQMAREMCDYAKQAGLSGEDLLATAVEFTATTIARKVRRLAAADKSLAKLYLTGGGRKNSFLVRRLQKLLPEMEICQGDDLGVDADLIEAAAYAVMGEACVRSESLSLTLKRKTGAAAVLGRIAQPPVLIR